MDDFERYNFWHSEMDNYVLDKKIDKILRQSFNKYLVRHVPIKDDSRCRTEIMFDEMRNEIMSAKKDLS